MSIYPVRAKTWFNGDPNGEMVRHLTLMMRCASCGDKCNYNKLYCHHSLPYGYGEIWCSNRCLNSNKVNKRPNRRLENRWKRKYK